MTQQIYIKPETFVAAVADASEVGEWYSQHINGKVVVQYGNQEIAAWACKGETGTIYAYGFVGKYRTGNKLWNVTMDARNGLPTCIWFGRDDRAGNFNKTSSIWFMPEKFFN